MKIAVIGAGAVGGYYGALLARRGHQVSFVARGAHRDAIRAHGLRVVGPLGDFTVQTPAESDPAAIGRVDVVVHTVKTYDNATAIPLIKPLLGPKTFVLRCKTAWTAPSGSPRLPASRRRLRLDHRAAIEGPGVIRQTGTHRRIVFGEYFNPPASIRRA